VQISKLNVKVIIRWVIFYSLLLFLWAKMNHWDLQSRELCCGLYSEYKMYYLPFPSVVSSERAIWGDGTTRVYWIGVILNVLLFIVVIAFSIIRARNTISISKTLGKSAKRLIPKNLLN